MLTLTQQRILLLAACVMSAFLLWRSIVPAGNPATPGNWEEAIRRESIELLAGIRSTNDLQSVRGNGGVVLYLTNGSWIVIRAIVQYEPSREVVIARDSEGGWFQSTRQFSGGLSWYPGYKMQVAAPGDDPVVTTMECIQLHEVEKSRDLVEARTQMEKLLGFVPMVVTESSPASQ